MDNVTNAAVNASGVVFIEGYDVPQMFPNTVIGAAENVHTEVDQLLLETKDVDVNAQGGHFWNALQTASSRRHWDIVQLLLDKGAYVNAQGGIYSNALQAASSWGYRDIVQIPFMNIKLVLSDFQTRKCK